MARYARDEAGNIFEIDEQGNVIGPATPSSSVVAPNPVRVAEKQREADRQSAADARSAETDRRANAAADRAEREWNATHNPDGSPKNKSGNKPMRQGDADHLEEQINAYSYLKEAASTFQDDYAGNTVTGGLENILQRRLGTGTEGQADWWANFKTADNLIRNKLFGASLTAGEKSAYAETTIDPSMDPAIIKQNLARRAEIAKSVLSRRVQRLHKTYNPEEVEASLGEFAPELLGTDKMDKTSAITSNALSSDQQSVATGDTITETQRGPVEKKLSAMLQQGASSASIRSYAKQNNFPAGKVERVLAWRTMNPQYKGPYDVTTETIRPASMLNKIEASPLATVATQAANATSAGLLDEIGGATNSLLTGADLSDSIAAADMNKQAQAALNPKSALVGNVLGGTAAVAGGGIGLKALLEGGAKAGLGRNALAWAARNPIKATAIGDAGYGTAYGAGEMNDNRLAGAAIGAPAGFVGSLGGSAITSGVGRGIRGVVDPAVERLRAAGIPLTGAEVLGGGWKKAQDALTSLPVVGSMVARRTEEGRRALNEAAFNAAGNTVGQPINAVGQEGINLLNAAKSKAYSDALDPINLDLMDPVFGQDIQALGAEILKIPNADARKVAFEALEGRIKSNLDPGTSNMAGRNFQEAYRGLAREVKEERPYKYEIGQVARGGQDALAGAVQRQAPGAYDGFLKANSANKHLNILADAVNAAKSQIDDGGDVLFTPAQLNTASTNATKNYGGKLAAAMGNKPFNELVQDAQKVMAAKVPDSGTATRAAIGLGLTSLGTGGAGYGAEGGSGATVGALAPAAVLTLLGTRRGQQALSAMLLRSQAFRKAGNTVVDRANVGGNVLAGAGIPLLYPPTM